MRKIPRLVNEELSHLVEQLSAYKENVSSAIYEQYKTAFVLSGTINLRGKAGDALKEYIHVSHLNLTQKIINVMDEITEVAAKMENNFLNFESAANGIVGSGTLENVHTHMQRGNDRFTDMDDTARRLLYRASEFIQTTDLGSDHVATAYTNLFDHLDNTKTGLEDTDSSLQADIDRVTNRVFELQTHIFALAENFRDENGINYSKLNEIHTQDWYTVENNHAFKEMQEDDPFVYDAGHASVAEGQWIAGTSDTNYITASGNVLGANGSVTQSGSLFDQNNPLTMDREGEAVVLSGKVQGETLAGYGKLDTSGQVVGAAGNLHLGPDGIGAEGKVAVIEVKGTAMVGTDNFNGYVAGHAEALTAQAHTNFILPDDQNGDMKLGIGGKVQGATVGVETGFSLFDINSPGVLSEDKEGDKKKSMLGLKAGLNAGPQIGGNVDFEKTNVYSNDYLSVHANEIDIDLKLVVGVKLSVALSSIQLKWPW